MKTLLLATNNAKKAKELREILCPLGGPSGIAQSRFMVKTLADVGIDVDVVEDAPDFRGNAWKKCREIVAVVKARKIAVDVVMADDSGLIVDALDGHPGVRSARFADDAGYVVAGLDKDARNNRLLLTLLAPVPQEKRTARFCACVVAHDVGSGKDVEATGFVEGAIASDEEGGGGFGYDPLFIVTEVGQRMAALSPDEKHRISHRGRALEQLLPQL